MNPLTSHRAIEKHPNYHEEPMNKVRLLLILFMASEKNGKYAIGTHQAVKKYYSIEDFF